MVLDVLLLIFYLNDRKQKTVYFNKESDIKILIMEFLRVQFWGQYYLYYL